MGEINAVVNAGDTSSDVYHAGLTGMLSPFNMSQVCCLK